MRSTGDPGSSSPTTGYILVMFRDARTIPAELLILAAQDFDGEPLARVKIDNWMPASVHGNWIPDSQG